MKTSLEQPFDGFSPGSLKFFHDLERNNNREWFAEHKDEYVRYAAEPMKRLVVSLAPMIRQLDPLILTDPNRTMSRIYRDTRFANDKTPYWPYLWIAFRHASKTWYSAPTFFFEIDGSGYSFGMNIYAPSAATMRRFRERIDADPRRFLETIEPVRKSRSLRLKPDHYKRRLPCELGKRIEPWYQSRAIAVFASREPDKTLYSKKLVDLLIDRYVLLKPLYDFLWSVTE